MPVCRIVVILTDNESHLIYYLTDFAVRMHKAKLVLYRFEVDVSGLVKYVPETQISIYYLCPMDASPFDVIEIQMHGMLQRASFTIQIYVPDIYNLNISSNMS